mgnify:CR=1 FL=1
MEIKTTVVNGKIIASVKGEGKLLRDVSSALDLMADVRYTADCDRVALPKSSVADEFFVLSTKLAGDILQKFINYQMKLAIYGDFSAYTSKPLRDFIYESNNGRDIFFVLTEEEAIKRLAES